MPHPKQVRSFAFDLSRLYKLEQRPDVLQPYNLTPADMNGGYTALATRLERVLSNT